jgi:hypothetical protein
MKITGRLENWSYDNVNHVLWGNIFEDERGRFTDGGYIHTSNLRHPKNTEFKSGMIVDTMNSKYLLGEPWSDKKEQTSE